LPLGPVQYRRPAGGLWEALVEEGVWWLKNTGATCGKAALFGNWVPLISSVLPGARGSDTLTKDPRERRLVSTARTRTKGDSMSVAARLRRLDPVLLLVALALGGFGVLAVYAADTDYLRYYYATNQAVGLAAGVALATALSLLDYRYLERHLRPIYGLAIFMLLVVLVAGSEVHGSKSWLDVGPIQVQPSEFAKPLMIVVLAGYAAHNSFASNETFVKALGIVAVPVFLVVGQPDLGTAIVFGAVFVAMAFVGGARWYQLGALFAAAALIFALAVKQRILEDYQLARLTCFLDPQSAPEACYQVDNSKMAIGSGGLTGKGFDASTTLGDLGYLPEDRTDFIFASLGERIGFVGSVLVLILFFLLIWRVLHAATISRDRFGVLVAVGVAAMVTFHVLINVGMSIGIMPVTGLPLPFVSYGRSNLLMSLLSVGLVQSIVVQSRLKSEGDPRP
jgi:rod shape determining protein RodA